MAYLELFHAETLLLHAIDNIPQARHLRAKLVARGSDRAEFSDAAQLLSRVPDVRQDLIDRVKGEIDRGTYETDEKIDKAIESLLEDLA